MQQDVVNPKTDLFRALFDASPDAIVVVEAATNTIVDANAQAQGWNVAAIAEGCGDGHRLLAYNGDTIAVAARVTPVTLDERSYLVIVAKKIGAALVGGSSGAPAAAREDRPACPGIIGEGARVRDVCRLVRSVAASDATVLIQGESGTGKEVVADAIHALSRRAGAPFVKVNCAALTETLLESELFGHVKGAFTGALRDRRGRFKQADRGTILLDEIGSMPLAGQAALLRVLQEREFEPVGSSITTSVDVRVIASTNADLSRAVADAAFRADLFYRLNVFGIVVPPLRERLDDIPELSRHFLRRFNEALGKRISGFTPAAIDALLAHEWPGNVRELENAIEHAAIVEPGHVIAPSSLPATIRTCGGEPKDQPQTELGLRARLHLAERQILLETLTRANGIKKRAAEMLGIDSRNMPYFLRKHRLHDAARS